MEINDIKDDEEVWVNIKGFSILINPTFEGVVVDIYPNVEDKDNVIATTYAFDSDLDNDDEFPVIEDDLEDDDDEFPVIEDDLEDVYEEEYKQRCAHCAYLTEDNDMEWVCDKCGENCKTIMYCPDVEDDEIRCPECGWEGTKEQLSVVMTPDEFKGLDETPCCPECKNTINLD